MQVRQTYLPLDVRNNAFNMKREKNYDALKKVNWGCNFTLPEG